MVRFKDIDMDEESARQILMMCLELSSKSNCKRFNFGAMLFDLYTRENIGYGFNTAPPNIEPCKTCLRVELGCKSSTHYEICKTVHAEWWAIINAFGRVSDLEGSIMFVAGKPPGSRTGLLPRPTSNPVFRCTLCARLMDAVGVKYVVTAVDDKEDFFGWKPRITTIKEAIKEAYDYTIKAVKENKEMFYDESKTVG